MWYQSLLAHVDRVHMHTVSDTVVEAVGSHFSSPSKGENLINGM